MQYTLTLTPEHLTLAACVGGALLYAVIGAFIGGACAAGAYPSNYALESPTQTFWTGIDKAVAISTGILWPLVIVLLGFYVPFRALAPVAVLGSRTVDCMRGLQTWTGSKT